VDGDFLPREPYDLLRDVNYLVTNDVMSCDVMLGVNNDEGGDLALLDTEKYPVDVEISILQGLASRNRGEKIPETSSRARTLIDVALFFYNGAVVESGKKADIKDVVDLWSDVFFTVPSVDWMRALADAKQKSPALTGVTSSGGHYFYLFNHYPSSKADRTAAKGMGHFEDIKYEFDDVKGRVDFGADDYAVSRTFRAMVTDFAKTGQSQVTAQTPTGPNAWPQFTSDEEKYLSLEASPRAVSDLYSKRVALWTDLMPALVNSTRDETTPGCQGGLGSGTKNFVFKGRLNFFKLP